MNKIKVVKAGTLIDKAVLLIIRDGACIGEIKIPEAEVEDFLRELRRFKWEDQT